MHSITGKEPGAGVVGRFAGAFSPVPPEKGRDDVRQGEPHPLLH